MYTHFRMAFFNLTSEVWIMIKKKKIWCSVDVSVFVLFLNFLYIKHFSLSDGCLITLGIIFKLSLKTVTKQLRNKILSLHTTNSVSHHCCFRPPLFTFFYIKRKFSTSGFWRIYKVSKVLKTIIYLEKD